MKKFLLCCVAFCSIGSLFCQDTLYVNIAAEAAGDGSSWATPFKDIQVAIDSSDVGDHIWVAKGEYKPNKLIEFGTLNQEKTFLIDKPT